MIAHNAPDLTGKFSIDLFMVLAIMPIVPFPIENIKFSKEHQTTPVQGSS